MIDPMMQGGGGEMAMTDDPAMATSAAASPALPGPAPAPAPPAPASGLLALLRMPTAEAVRRVYSMASSAAKAKSKLDAATHRQSAHDYHAELAKAPLARHYKTLLAARRQLDKLAQERRRLGLLKLEAERAGKSSASLYEIQIGQVNAAMGHVAAGTLMFLDEVASA